MKENDPIKDTLKLWQVRPAIDASLAYKVRQKVEDNIDVFAFFLRKEWRTAIVGVSLLFIIVAGITGGTVAEQQKAADTQAMVSLYLSKINAM